MSGMYGDRAELYDLIYHFKRYDKEAERLHGVLADLGVREGGRVLEVACGTGSFLAELRRWYAVQGLDRSEQMLAIAARKVPTVPLRCADMCDFSVEEPFDAVVCLFSSIGHLPGLAALDRALRCFAAALVPGGALVIEPWITVEELHEGQQVRQTYNRPELYLIRDTQVGRRGDVALLDMRWTVQRPGAPLETFREVHEAWMPSRRTFLTALRAAGFGARFDPRGLMDKRGLYVGTRG